MSGGRGLEASEESFWSWMNWTPCADLVVHHVLHYTRWFVRFSDNSTAHAALNIFLENGISAEWASKNLQPNAQSREARPTIYLGRLTEKDDERAIAGILEQFAGLYDLKIHNKQGQPYSYGFVAFQSETDCNAPWPDNIPDVYYFVLQAQCASYRSVYVSDLRLLLKWFMLFMYVSMWLHVCAWVVRM